MVSGGRPGTFFIPEAILGGPHGSTCWLGEAGLIDLVGFTPLPLWSVVRGGESALRPLEWDASEGGQCLLLLR